MSAEGRGDILGSCRGDVLGLEVWEGKVRSVLHRGVNEDERREEKPQAECGRASEIAGYICMYI